MTTTVKLNIEKRNEEKNPRELRAEGFLTGTIYGKGIESVSVQMNERDFINTYKKVNDATFEVTVDKKDYKVQVVKLQKNYRTSENLNVEFKVV